MCQRSLHFAFLDSCWKEKAGVETKMGMRRRTRRVGEKSAPSQESGVHEDREQEVDGFVRACRLVAPRPGSKTVLKEWANDL
jgi:hypothetical protein